MANIRKYYSQQVAKLKKLLPHQPLLFARLAECYINLGKIKPAATLLSKGLNQNPDYALGWVIKGYLHQRTNQDNLARSAYERALQIDPTIQTARIHCCELAQNEDDWEGYLNHLRMLVKYNPLDADLQSMLQIALMRKVAIDAKLYSPMEIKRMMPATLRQELLKRGLLPDELKRKVERPIDIAKPVMPKVEVEPEPVVRERPKLAWDDLKYEEEEIGFRGKIKTEQVEEPLTIEDEKDEERIVKVSWADAISGTTDSPFVEISGEQYESYKEQELIAPSDEIKTTQIRESVEEINEVASEKGYIEEKSEDYYDKLKTFEYSTKPSEKELKESEIISEPVKEVGELEVPTDELRESSIDEEAVEFIPEPRRAKKLPLIKPFESLKPPEEVVTTKLSEDISDEELPPTPKTEPEDKTIEPIKVVRDETPILRILKMKKESIATPDSSVPSGTVAKTSVQPDVIAPKSVSPEAVTPKLTTPISDAKPIQVKDEIDLETREASVVKPKPPIIETPIDIISGEQPTTEESQPEKRIKRPVLETVLDMIIGEDMKKPEESPALPTETPPSENVSGDKTFKETVASTESVEEPIIEEKPLQMPPKDSAREEETRQRLASIAKEITQKPVGKKSPVNNAKKTDKNEKIDEQAKPKIATKTLAELYASQGDWARAIEVYEELLRKFPNNEAYQKRIEVLRVKLDSGA